MMKDTFQAIGAVLDVHNLRDACFGAKGFRITDSAGLKDLQLGYSVHPDGSDLTGPNEGDWQESWVVIGTDTEVGDPFFVDTSEPDWPVLTAMHGMGDWGGEEVATSLQAFLDVMSYLRSISGQDHARIVPDERTISDEKALATIEATLVRMSGENYFWHNFLQQHRQWLADAEEF